MNYKKQIENYVPKCEQERVDKKNMYHYIEQFSHNILHRSNEIAHMTSSGLIMNKEQTKMLMIHHNIYKTWTWTGGHMDGEQDLLYVAVKEAKEETGLVTIEPLAQRIMSIDILPVWGHVKHGKYVGAHLHLNVAFVLIADEDEKLIINKEETSNVKWVDIADIESYSNEPDLINVYNKLIVAAKNYDQSKEVVISKRHKIETEDSMMVALKKATIPIAVHEAKSAYYKAMLVKLAIDRSGHMIKNTSKYISKQIRTPKIKQIEKLK